MAEVQTQKKLSESAILDMFDGMENAPGVKLPFLPVGTHTVELELIEAFKSQKTKAPGVRGEVTIVETSAPTETEVGRRHTIVHSKTSQYDYWLGEVQALVAAALGLEPQKVNPQTSAQFIAKYEQAKAELGKAKIKVVVTKEAGGKNGHFFKNVYSPA